MKATKLIATVTALSLIFAGTAKVSMNNDSMINVIDVVILVNIILDW